jgi:nucleoside-diphosphate-sugar epimerase
MILITTAGKVGSEAARLLTEQGEPVRVLARHPEKVAMLSQAGVDVVEGDLDAPATIDAAMRDVSYVILVSLAIPTQELNVVTSAVRAGVDHVVKITSKASADSPIARRRGARPTGSPVPSQSPTQTQQRSCQRCSAVPSVFTHSPTSSRSRRWSASASQITSRR